MYVNHQAGQVAEFIAAAYFASLGYSVWWPTTPSSRSDFAIGTPQQFQTVQVKKATWGKQPNGRETLKLNVTGGSARQYKRGDFDVLCIVDDASRIWVVPFDEIGGRKVLTLDHRGGRSRSRNPVSSYDPAKWRVR